MAARILFDSGEGVRRYKAVEDPRPTSWLPAAARLAALALALLMTTSACERAKAKQEAAAPPPPPPGVVVAEVVERPVPIVRDFTARTDAVPTVEVRARVAGVLEQVQFREGSVVKQGQTLFVIQREEYQAALASARAHLAKAHADLTRARDVSVVATAKAQLEQRKAELGKTQKDVARFRPLVEAQAIPQQDLDTAVAAEKVAAAGVEASESQLRDTELVQRTQIQLAEAAVQSAQASVTQAELNLSYTTIQSPINGIIGKLLVDRGNLVGKSEPTLLATVSSMDPIFVDFSVAEADYLRLAPRINVDAEGRVRDAKATLELYLADGSLLPHRGRVDFVDRAVDLKTGTIGVRAQFPNPGNLVRPGQFARVRSVVEERPKAVLVPQLAVQEQQGAKTVLVVDGESKADAAPRDDRRALRRPLHHQGGLEAGRARDRGGMAEGPARHGGEGRAEARDRREADTGTAGAGRPARAGPDASAVGQAEVRGLAAWRSSSSAAPSSRSSSRS